jgi:RHS repeat-associated protein
MGCLKLPYYEKEGSDIFLSLWRKNEPGEIGINYTTFGAHMKGRTWNGEANRWQFNGKEKDSETGYTDYGFRQYDEIIGRFITPDPLTRKYPMLTPYQFASNRPIDGVDLDGLEFSKASTVDSNTGKTKIEITVKIKVNLDGISSKLATSYLTEIRNQFSGIIRTASDSKVEYSGRLVFDDNATISLGIGYGSDDSGFVGVSGPGAMQVPVGTKNASGQIVKQYSTTYFAETVVHEVLHQGGVVHPTEESASEDVRLNKVVAGYFEEEGVKYPAFKYNSTEKTVPNIHNNVMIDSHITVDDKKVGSFRNKDQSGANQVTKGQLKTVEKNIDKGRVNGEPMNDMN